MRDDEVRNRFEFHPATPSTGPIHDRIREVFRETAEWVNDAENLIPECREKSLSLTALQEAMMWANAAVAIHTKTDPPNTDGEVQDNPEIWLMGRASGNTFEQIDLG